MTNKVKPADMSAGFCLVHIVCLHIIVDHFAVVLLLSLNVVQNGARARVTKFEDASVIQAGCVLFCCEQVCAKIAVVGLVGRICGRIGCREGRKAVLVSASHVRYCAVFHLSKRVQMPLLCLSDLREKGL